MSTEHIDKIARAVLYEGYILYPYRPSSVKNRQRWNFGVLYPPAWSAAQTGSDRSYFQMDCLAMGGEASQIHVTVRFLQAVAQGAAACEWQEAVERSVEVRDLTFGRIAREPAIETFACETLTGEARISAEAVRDGLFRVGVRVQNTTGFAGGTREEALLRSLASAHAVLEIRGGEFVSQTDPPDSVRSAAEACANVGVWPVLVGEEGARDTVLASPIILSDYPQVAPESSGDLFDGTEIDEILSLRILTMTDAEKAEMRDSDERARRILDRLESAPAEHLMQLHGTIRQLRPQAGADFWNTPGVSSGSWPEAPQLTSTRVAGVEVKKGDRVRLRPGKRADIFDTFLDGKTAVVEAIEQDYEDNVHIAVVLEDDPGRDLGEMRQAGHRFFFSGSEIEPIEAAL